PLPPQFEMFQPHISRTHSLVIRSRRTSLLHPGSSTSWHKPCLRKAATAAEQRSRTCALEPQSPHCQEAGGRNFLRSGFGRAISPLILNQTHVWQSSSLTTEPRSQR